MMKSTLTRWILIAKLVSWTVLCSAQLQLYTVIIDTTKEVTGIKLGDSNYYLLSEAKGDKCLRCLLTSERNTRLLEKMYNYCDSINMEKSQYIQVLEHRNEQLSKMIDEQKDILNDLLKRETYWENKYRYSKRQEILKMVGIAGLSAAFGILVYDYYQDK